MNPNVGFFSLVQYLPDPGRLEVANIGVLLFCPGQRFLQAKTARDNSRIRHIFGSQGHDWDRINAFKQGLEERLVREQQAIRTEEDLRRFIGSRANEVRITPPRFIKVGDCERQLDDLFTQYIGTSETKATRRSPRTVLSRAFRQAKLEDKIQRNIVVEMPFLKERSAKFPFAYQNDRLHLLRPVIFRGGQNSDPANQAYRHAVQGRFLHDHENKSLGKTSLIVVAQVESVDKQQMRALEKLFEENNTQLYTTNEVPKLVQEIRLHANSTVLKPPSLGL